jgi:hypothetical protein
LTKINCWCILYSAIKHSFLQQFTVNQTEGECVMSLVSADFDIGLCSINWGYCEAFIETSKHLKLTEEEMERRHEMGIESAKVLLPPAGCRKLTPEEKKAGRRILPVEVKAKKYAQ